MTGAGQRRARLALAALALLGASPLVARADIPPQKRSVAGLYFEAIRGATVPSNVYQFVLIACDAPHPNCAAAKAAGVIGGLVVSVNGVANAEGAPDLGAVFAGTPAGQRVRVVFRGGQRVAGDKLTTLTTVSFASR